MCSVIVVTIFDRFSVLLQVEEYRQRLDEIMLKSEDGIPLLPELYAVPPELVSDNFSLCISNHIEGQLSTRDHRSHLVEFLFCF